MKLKTFVCHGCLLASFAAQGVAIIKPAGWRCPDLFGC